MDFSLLSSSIHGNFQARILEWVAIAFSRGSSWSRDWTQEAGGLLTTEPRGKPPGISLFKNETKQKISPEDCDGLLQWQENGFFTPKLSGNSCLAIKYEFYFTRAKYTGLIIGILHSRKLKLREYEWLCQNKGSEGEGKPHLLEVTKTPSAQNFMLGH